MVKVLTWMPESLFASNNWTLYILPTSFLLFCQATKEPKGYFILRFSRYMPLLSCRTLSDWSGGGFNHGLGA
jgi:hypothetical protein